MTDAKCPHCGWTNTRDGDPYPCDDCGYDGGSSYPQIGRLGTASRRDPYDEFVDHHGNDVYESVPEMTEIIEGLRAENGALRQALAEVMDLALDGDGDHHKAPDACEAIYDRLAEYLPAERECELCGKPGCEPNYHFL